MSEPLLPEDPPALGGYRLVSRLGRGGMGTVYLGEDGQGRRFAIKVINDEYSDDVQFQKRFRREVEAARRVPRFCTAPVVDVDFEGRPWYVVTEYVAGPSLDRAVAESGPIRGADLDGLAIGIATALGAIHGAGLVHRDLKPSNVLLSAVGPRVIDFGIAKSVGAPVGATGLTHTGQIIGTPAYLAPEQITGGEITPATDVFSWACVVAHAGTGRSPFTGRTLPEILHHVAYRPPDLDELDPRLVPLLTRALDKDPSRRPTIAELLAELTGRAGQAGPRRPTMPSPPVQAPSAPPGPSFSLPPGYGAPMTRPPGRIRSSKGGRNLVLGAVGGAALVIAAFFLLLLDRDDQEKNTSADRVVPGTVGESRTSAADPENGSDFDGRFVGLWRGPVTQSNYTPYSVDMSITGGKVGEKIGSTTYPELGCRADLLLLEQAAGRLVVSETVAEVGVNCSNVKITLTYRDDGRVDYFFGGSTVTGRALLTKVPSSDPS